MTTTIRLREQIWEQTRREALASEDESVAFLTARYLQAHDKTILLGQRVITARDQDYLRQGPLHLSISPLYVSRAIGAAEDTPHMTVVMVHSHPFDQGKPGYSPIDDHGEARTAATIAQNLMGAPVGSMLLGQNDATARCWFPTPIRNMQTDITILRRHIAEFIVDVDHMKDVRIDRQIRALGHKVQQSLSHITVGIVGLGGTGSNIAEQLVRMGVRRFFLVDNDRIEPSNLSRVYGSHHVHLVRTQYKVEIAAEHLRNINPEIHCEQLPDSVLKNGVLRKLASCDVIFSCVDRHAPRAVLNELAYQCFVPIIDVGVGLDGNGGGAVRATRVGPDLPCLWCLDIVRADAITTEHLSPEEHERQRREGYVAPCDHAPSVVTYTTMAASMGMMLFLEMLSSAASDHSTIVFDIGSHETLLLRGTVQPECVCTGRLGWGFDIPFSVAD